MAKLPFLGSLIVVFIWLTFASDTGAEGIGVILFFLKCYSLKSVSDNPNKQPVWELYIEA